MDNGSSGRLVNHGSARPSDESARRSARPWAYALALYRDPGATLDDLREAVSTLEDAERIGRRVLGGENPTAVTIGEALKISRAKLAAREAQGQGA